MNGEQITKLESDVKVFLDGEFMGWANETIENSEGTFYAYDGQYLDDNGDYIYINGYGVTVE
jgi:hypothetical protein